jgi:hypothetical protein
MFTLSGVQKATQFSGTVQRGAQAESFSFSKLGVRPYWDLSVTVEGGFNNVWRWLGQPSVYRVQHTTSQSGTDRAYISDLNFFDTRADGFWDGRTARIYTVTNGVRSLLTETTVTATKVDLTSLATGTNQMVTATTYQWPLQNFYRPSVGYWFRVAAINGSGQVGTYSSWVQYTAPASIGTTTATNPTLTSITHTGTAAISAPTGVAVAAKSGDTATAEVTWSAVGGASGYVVQLSWQDPALNASPEYIDLDTSGLTIPQGAVVFLDWPVTAFTDKWGSRIWGTDEAVGGTSAGVSSWVAYTEGDPAPTGIFGLYFLRYTMSGSGNLFNSGGNFVAHGGQRQTFYRVLEANKTYRARFLMRAASSVMATLAINGVTTGGSTALSVTTSWQWFQVDFSRTSVLDDETLYFFSLTVPGAATVDVAAYEFFDPALDRDDFSQDEKNRISPDLFLRDHTLIKPGRNTVSMRQALSPHGQTTRGGSVHNILRKAQLNDCKPWIQLEWHLSDDEWLDFVAYMAAPVSSNHPMALMRQAQGQTTPWTDVFEEVWLEFGNEAWQDGSIPAFWVTNNSGFQFRDQGTLATLTGAQTYGAHCQGIINKMKTSPYWRAFRSKAMLYGGGFFENASFEQDALEYAPDLTATGTAAYNGGWESTSQIADESGDIFKTILRAYPSATQFTSSISAVNNVGASRIFYEAGPGYQLDGLSGAIVDHDAAVLQEIACKSRAMGTATIASFAVRAANGHNGDNFFTIAPGSNWTSHAAHYHGDGTYMSWALLKMVWEAVGRCIVRKIALVSPPTDAGVELLQAFEFKSAADPTNRVIVAANRDIDVSLLPPTDPLYNVTPSGLHACSIPTGIASCSGLEYYANVGNFRQHNRFPVGYRLTPTSGTAKGPLVGNPVGTADTLSVAFTYNWTTGTPLGDADPIDIDDTYGAVAGGLPAGNCVLLHLTGCVDA